MTCPSCGRPVAPNASCCAPDQRWSGAPVDGYTVQLDSAAPAIGPMQPLRKPAITSVVTVALSSLFTVAEFVLARFGVATVDLVQLSAVTVVLFTMSVVLTVVLIVALLSWQYAALSNVHLLPDARPRWAAGWAVGAWFIPLANLVLVPLVANDTARNSVPSQRHGERRLLGWLVLAWWIGFVGSSAVAAVANRGNFDHVLYVALGSLSVALRVVGGAALIVLVIRVTRLQEQRAELGWVRPVVAPPPVVLAVPATQVVTAPPAAQPTTPTPPRVRPAVPAENGPAQNTV